MQESVRKLCIYVTVYVLCTSMHMYRRRERREKENLEIPLQP